MPPQLCGRHFLPGDGQKFPRKVLKNLKNYPPGLFSGPVQVQEAENGSCAIGMSGWRFGDE
jgi:hypothetical protein